MPKVIERMELDYVVGPYVRQFCGPIFFTNSLQVPNASANGSFGLVDTGRKKLLVTCHHAWEEFQVARHNQPNLQMCLCLDQGPPVVFAPSSPIAEDPRLDIATFDMKALLAACVGRKFYPLMQKRPRKVLAGDGLFFIGFPGRMRRIEHGAIVFGRAPFAVHLCSADSWHIQSDISKLAMTPDEFGGISGCPCFLLRPGKRTVMAGAGEATTVQLVGFATSVLFGRYLSFTHASCLNGDGTINAQ